MEGRNQHEKTKDLSNKLSQNSYFIYDNQRQLPKAIKNQTYISISISILYEQNVRLTAINELNLADEQKIYHPRG